MQTESHSQTAAFIWSVADVLRGDFKQSQYGRITLPFTLLRRLECVLEPTKAQVLDAAQEHASKLSYYCHPVKGRFATRYKAIIDQIQTWQEVRRQAEKNGDKAGLHRAEQEIKDAGTIRDELDLFRRNLQSLVRTYEFLSQIVHFDDRELEQLSVYAKHLHPLLHVDRLNEGGIDVSELELTHYYRITKRAEHHLRLEEEQGDYGGLKPVSNVGSGKPHDPEKQRLAEITDKLNDLYGAEVSDEGKLHFANGIVDRIERDEATMEQMRNHSEDQIMYGLVPKWVTDAVLDAMSDHKKLSMPLLEDEETGRQLALLILKLLTTKNPAKSGF